MEQFLKKLLKYKWVSKRDKLLVVCGSTVDNDRLKKLHFNNYLITSAYKKIPGVKRYQQADAQQLPFKDKSFDVAVVNLGLHHCASPHQALCEMYRVAKKAIIVREAQDSILTRIMVKLNLVLEYEIANVSDGVRVDTNHSITNYIYRWKKNEVIKTLNSYDPSRSHDIRFYSSFTFYPSFLDKGGFWEKKMISKVLGKKLTVKLINLLVLLLNSFASNLGNDFGFIVKKDTSPVKPWIKIINPNGNLRVNKFKQTIISRLS